jgi:hypothetical protein
VAAATAMAAAAAAMLRERAGRHYRRESKRPEENGNFSNQVRIFHNVTRSNIP